MLPATKRLLQNHKKELENHILIIVQHALPDTSVFIKELMEAECNVAGFIPIPYSIRKEVIEDISQYCSVFQEELVAISQRITSLIKEWNSSGKKIIIHEVGGYFADAVLDGAIENTNCILGVIEETKRGLWNYQKLKTISFPVLHIADNDLKNAEGAVVGEAIARNSLKGLRMDKLNFETSVFGVVGFGVIGEGVCHSLRKLGMDVRVIEIDPIKLAIARLKGFKCYQPEAISEDINVIIGTTGKTLICDNIVSKKHNCVYLISGSSRRYEFDHYIASLRTIEKIEEEVSITRYERSSGGIVCVLNDGYPINFIGPSLTAELSDLMYAQIVAAMIEISIGNLSSGLMSLNNKVLRKVADLWLSEHKELT